MDFSPGRWPCPASTCTKMPPGRSTRKNSAPAVRANMDSTQSNPPSANGRWAAVAVSQWAPRSRAAA